MLCDHQKNMDKSDKLALFIAVLVILGSMLTFLIWSNYFKI